MPNITTKSNDPRELAVAEIVRGLYQKYAVPAFTNEILIERGAIPHSHPVLTLNTRVTDESLILKTLIHELFHWHESKHSKTTEAIEYLKTKYPDNGECSKSKFPDSYWTHIIVCFNTRRYLEKLLSAEDIGWIYQQWQAYPTIEKLVQEKGREIEADLKKFGLVCNEREASI